MMNDISLPEADGENRMNLVDIVFLGWYHICDKTIYANVADTEGIGPKEHSFFITFLIHGINLWTLVSYAVAKYLGVNEPLYVSLTIAVTVFVVGYFWFFRKRANRIIARNIKNGKLVLYVLIALAYVVVSVFLMFSVGNYVREIVLSKKV